MRVVMNKKPLLNILLCFVLMTIIWLLATTFLFKARLGGVGGFSIRLFNNYILCASNSSDKSIYLSPDGSMSGGTTIVPSHITRLNTKGNIIFGERYKIGPLHKGKYLFKEFKGYFILDTETSSVVLDLPKEQWLAQLKKYNINEEPKLIHPSFFFNMMRDK